jgi:hypothetical protein
METVEYSEQQGLETPKRPTFLTVLVILTWLSVGMMIMTNFTGLVTGPLGEEELLEQEVKAAESIVELREVGQESFIQFIEVGLERNRYLHEKAFYQANIVTLILAILGAVAAWFMWNGRKLGFHLYIVYSLLTVVQSYFVYPMELIIQVEIYFNLAISALFVFMYSRNLHWMNA